MSRLEVLWLLLLGVCVTAVILWTLDRELDRARARQARDALDYLAGHLRLALGEDLAGWPEGVAVLHGPGKLPAGAWDGEALPMAQFLPEGCFVPADPWGGAFVVYRDQERSVVLLSAGPDGSIETLEEAGESMRQPILGPTAGGPD